MAEIGEVPGGGLPWGGIVKVQTPFTDQVTANLLAQQADRRKFQQETTIKTDDLMNKELANVRSVDMGSVMDGYGKWKDIAMKMLSPAVQNNPKLYNDLQVQRNAALGQTMSNINRSVQLNTQAKELVAERKTKPNLYSDDFGDKLAAFNKTPMDQLQNHPQYGDLTNPDAFRYTGSQTDFEKMEATAAGKPSAVQGAEKTEKLSDMQSRVTPTLFGSTPAQFYENMRGQLAQHIPGRDAAAAWEATPEQQRAAVDQQFAAIPPDKWLAMTGQPKPQLLAPADPNNPAENYASYRAKLYAINAAPRAGTPQNVVNQAVKMGVQFKEREVMEALREGDREKLAKIRHGYKQMDTNQQSAVLDTTYNDIVNDAKAAPPHYYIAPDQKSSVKLSPMKLSNAMKQVLSPKDDKGHPIYPDYVGISDDGKNVYPMYTQGEEVDRKKDVDVKLSQPITSAEFKALLGKTLYGTKEASKETKTTTGASGIKWE